MPAYLLLTTEYVFNIKKNRAKFHYIITPVNHDYYIMNTNKTT